MYFFLAYGKIFKRQVLHIATLIDNTLNGLVWMIEIMQ